MYLSCPPLDANYLSSVPELETLPVFRCLQLLTFFGVFSHSFLWVGKEAQFHFNTAAIPDAVCRNSLCSMHRLLTQWIGLLKTAPDCAEWTSKSDCMFTVAKTILSQSQVGLCRIFYFYVPQFLHLWKGADNCANAWDCWEDGWAGICKARRMVSKPA